MKLYICMFLLLPLISACSSQADSTIRKNPSCFEYSAGMDWEAIQSNFGEAPLTLLPEPGKELSLNVQGYRNLKVFFYTKPQKSTGEGEVRFNEVVYKVKFCKEE